MLHYRFLLKADELFYWKLFLQPLMLNLSIAFSLFFYLNVGAFFLNQIEKILSYIQNAR